MSGLEKKSSSLDKSTIDTPPSDVESGSVTPYEGDAALSYLRQQIGDGDTGVADINESKLVWKIDFMIMPLMWCCYFLQYLDKTLINYVSIPHHSLYHG